MKLSENGDKIDGWLKNKGFIKGREKIGSKIVPSTTDIYKESFLNDTILGLRLYTVEVEGVEPTNNAAETAIRPAVIWRRK